MPVTGLDHINIRTTDVAASARFYVDLLDFEFGQGPAVMGNVPNWLFDKSGNPIIHFRVRKPDMASGGAIDHVALKCEGKAAILERLKRHAIRYDMAENVLPGITQIFVRDPHGVMLELNFTGE